MSCRARSEASGARMAARQGQRAAETRCPWKPGCLETQAGRFDPEVAAQYDAIRGSLLRLPSFVRHVAGVLEALP